MALEKKSKKSMDNLALVRRFFEKASRVLSSKRSLRLVLLQARVKAAKEKIHLKELYRQLLLGIDLIKAYANGIYREVPLKNITLIVAGLLYFLSPFDAIFDFLPFGLVDDVQVLLLIFGLVKGELDRFEEFRRHRRHPSSQDQESQ